MEVDEVVIGDRVKIKRVYYNQDEQGTYAKEGIILRKTNEIDKVLVGVIKPKDFEGHSDCDDEGNGYRNYENKCWHIHIIDLVPID